MELYNQRAGLDDHVKQQLKSDGTFNITFTVDRMFDITPYLKICTAAYSTNDIGPYNLERRFADESQECPGTVLAK